MEHLYIQDVVTIYNKIKDLPKDTIIKIESLIEETNFEILKTYSILMYLLQFEEIKMLFENYCDDCETEQETYIYAMYQFKEFECKKCKKTLNSPTKNCLIHFMKK